MAAQGWPAASLSILDSIAAWFDSLPVVQMKGLFLSPARVVVFVVDMLVGYASPGPRSSPRLTAIIEPLVRMLQRAYELGVRYFLLLQDSYSPDQVPHGPFGFHGLASGAEAAILPQLRALPFAHLLQAIPKSSPHPALGTSLDEWVDVHPGVNTYFVVGNCTDLSIYQVATYLQFRAHVRGLQRRLIVPADCVATYDLSDEQASQYGTMGHPGDLLHHLFLYHLAGSGVEVVKGLL